MPGRDTANLPDMLTKPLFVRIMVVYHTLATTLAPRECLLPKNTVLKVFISWKQVVLTVENYSGN